MIPPTALFREVTGEMLRAVVRHVLSGAHRFDSGPSIPREPLLPRTGPLESRTMAKEGVNVMAIPGRIAFDRVEVGNPVEIAFHVSLEGLRCRTFREFTLESPSKKDGPRAKIVHPGRELMEF